MPLPLDDDGDVDSEGVDSSSIETTRSGLTDRAEKPSQWMPFNYRSDRAVQHKLNQVELDAGKQSLQFKVNVHDWAVELVKPVTQAVEAGDGVTEDRSVNASKQISSRGEGPAGVGEHMNVMASPAGF